MIIITILIIFLFFVFGQKTGLVKSWFKPNLFCFHFTLWSTHKNINIYLATQTVEIKLSIIAQKKSTSLFESHIINLLSIHKSLSHFP